MNELTEKDYFEILNGERCGRHYSGNYYIVGRKTEEKPTKKQVMLKEGVGLPPTLNDNYDDNEKKIGPKRKRKKENDNRVDSELLRRLGYLNK